MSERDSNTPVRTEEHQVRSVAYDSLDKPYRGFAVRASYLMPPREGDALIEIFRRGSVWQSYYYPAYRIYNVAAHFRDAVDAQIMREETEACQT